ncbi:DUF2177 family protein [Singulisphaera sp. PoT]|uniref:DUF2177 family protein n=1 Tax=Singulisphaera sp. PoT TaxID=3411797 RepID=UPI003BF59E26
MNHLKIFAIVLPVFLLLDFFWLGVLMKGFYNTEIGELARRHSGALAPRWPAAILIYVLIPGGLVLFVNPLIGSNATIAEAFGWGAAFGLVLYGVFELTNYALLDKWTLRMTLVDIAWGTVLCGISGIVMRTARSMFT